MEILISLIILIGIIIFFKAKTTFCQKSKNSTLKGNNEIKKFNNDSLIKIEKIESLQEINENNLIEITDNKVFGHITNLLSSLFKTSVSAGNIINNKNLYKVIIPSGEKLANSKNIMGAKRAFYHTEKGIGGHADLIEVNNKTNVVANSVATIMNVSSLIVGEYYMTQINKELSQINNSISKIEHFQNNEYKSKVLALMTQIKKIALFQTEILESQELINEEIANLNKLEHECIQLLAQANVSISDFIKIDKLGFEEYERKTKELQGWCNYQQNLIQILYKIVELNYTFHLGNKTKEQCSVAFNEYFQHSKVIRATLNNWHKTHVEALGIDINEGTIKRVGLDGIIHKIPGLINNNLNYRSLSKETTEIISSQINTYLMDDKNDSINLFKQDVNIILKEGKVYYLPESS